MENLNLNAEIRTTEEKLSEVRTSKMVPAVVYGRHQEPILIKVDNSDFLRTFRKSGESHIINLSVDGKNIEVLVHEVQKEPVSGGFLHIDFFAITKGEKVHTKIHLQLVGVSQAVKEGAVIEQHIKDIEVKILPSDLVDAIEVDITALNEIGDHIKISDLKINSNIEVLTSDAIIVSASKPAKIEIVETTTETVAE
ncbi:MAG: 50S ribosomal protein L25 [Candidatus Gracilibacteria bacterium]|nr:50S ribosomal protein L25 [Candidatus Gracilibacteria bacterium]